MKELWKPIPSYENIYEASNLGNIRTCFGKTTCTKRHGIRHWEQRILKPKCCHATKSKNRYDLRVELWKNGEHKTYLVSRLVASAWIKDYLHSSKMTVNHIDNNSLNNNINNLEWCSRSENIRKGFETGCYKCCKKIELYDKRNNKKYEFISQSRASIFINHNTGYISNMIKKGVNENMNYKWRIID